MDQPVSTVPSHTRIPVKITRVECIPLSTPFKSPFKIASGKAREAVETLIVRLHTDQGVAGIGETQAWRRQGSAETLANLVRTIDNHFAPRVVGRSPFDVAAVLHELNEAMYNSFYAQAPIGDAMYDLMGKLLGVPVHQLLGGQCRDRVRVAAVLAMKGTTTSVIESAQDFVARGFRHLVLKIGSDPALDLRNAEALRHELGDKIALRVDANASMDYDGALRLLTRMEPFDIETAEQPLPIWDIDGMAALARAVRMPIMADESVSTDHSLLEIVRKRAASSFQSKVAKNGGLHYMQRLWHLAAAAGLGINPGNHPSTSVATASVAHLCAAWPTPLMAGVFAVGVSGALAADIVENPIVPVDGEVPIPSGPGLGVTLDERAIRSLRVDV
jgi:L-alanine-DL-glutamate epimerase-like enolase superfamily enzyme